MGRSGPIAFFVSLFIVAVGAIQLVATFHDYALDLARLNDLKREEAALTAQKKELENDISRWDDKNYVAAQARERLGFVFPGEQAVTVLNPQAVTGDDTTGDGGARRRDPDAATKTLPWYSELNYAFGKVDQGQPTDADVGEATGGSDDGADGDGADAAHQQKGHAQ